MPRNEGIEKVLSGYKKRRDRFEVRREALMKELFNKYPKLMELRREYASMRINERINRDDAQYPEKYKQIKQKYDELLSECLKKENIDPDMLEYKPLCGICNDTGYVGEDEKRYCKCVISNAAQIVLDSSAINDKETFANSDFDVFDDIRDILNGATQKAIMQKLYGYLLDWTSAFPGNEKTQLLFIGNVGLGKSYCLNAVAYEVINKGYSAMLISSFAINEAAFDEIKHSDSSSLAIMRSVDLLLIDDLGGEPVLNNITCPTLLNILNERTRQGLHTVVSTNLNRDMLEERYGTRVVSRLFDKARTVVPPIMGYDIRKKQPN